MPNWPFEAPFYALAVINENSWLGGKLEPFVLGEDVLLESLDRRYPCWFTDKGGYFFDVWLDCRENLDT